LGNLVVRIRNRLFCNHYPNQPNPMNQPTPLEINCSKAHCRCMQISPCGNHHYSDCQPNWGKQSPQPTPLWRSELHTLTFIDKEFNTPVLTESVALLFIENLIQEIEETLDKEKWDESGKGDYLINWTEAKERLLLKYGKGNL
jgi:hypothetical protein